MTPLLPLALTTLLFLLASSDSEVQQLADDILSQAESTFKAGSSPGRKAVVKSFTHHSCDCDEDIVRLTDVDVVSLPDGHVLVSGTANILKDVHRISGSVKMELEKGGKRRPVPCVNNIGCCEYPDLCATFETLSKSSLKCPVLKGSYKLPEEFKIDISKFSRLLSSHSFNVTAKAFCDGVNCLCSNINVTFD